MFPQSFVLCIRGFNSHLKWTIEWEYAIASECHGVLVVNVSPAEDAREAVKYGVDGILVSNHGARQLDGVPATVSIPEEIFFLIYFLLSLNLISDTLKYSCWFTHVENQQKFWLLVKITALVVQTEHLMWCENASE